MSGGERNWPTINARAISEECSPAHIRFLIEDAQDHIAAQAATLTALQAEVAALREAIQNPPQHRYWGAGEPDCPREIRAGNGELHTLRCKVCGTDSPRSPICFAAIRGLFDGS